MLSVTIPICNEAGNLAQLYDRAYATQNLPSPDGGGALRVNVHERLMLGRLVVGYNLFRWAASSEHPR